MSFITPPSFPGFSTAAYTAAPNNGANVAAVIAVGGTANVDLAMVPKASGAFIADVPDNTAAGGNKRGVDSTDLQRVRALATQVAQASETVIVGGSNNTATAVGAIVVGGAQNTANGLRSFVGGGGSNVAGTTSPDESATVGGGKTNTAAAGFSCVPGGYGANTRTTQGRFSFSSYGGLGSGKFQMSRLIETVETTTAAPTVVFVSQASGGSLDTSTALVLADNSANGFETIIAARNNATQAVSVWRVTGAIKRNAGAGTVSIVGAPTVTLIAQDAGAAAWAVAVGAAVGTGALQFTVTGAAGATIRWSVNTHLTEVTF